MKDSSEKFQFVNTLNEYGIKHHITTEATRIISTSATFIKNIFSNINECRASVHESIFLRSLLSGRFIWQLNDVNIQFFRDLLLKED